MSHAPPSALDGLSNHAPTDMALVLGARSGNALAFETIVRKHNRLLFRTARGVVADDAEAQDVVQETYLRAFRTLHTYRGDAALGSWLARIAINVAISAQRKTRRLVPMLADAWDDGTAREEDDMNLSIPEEEKPDALVERQQFRDLLQASIEGLPPIYRSVFILRAVEELSVEETAFCLCVSEDVVKTRYLRSRAMLQQRMATRVDALARDTFQFAGARCDAVVGHVMAALIREGLIRPH